MRIHKFQARTGGETLNLHQFARDGVTLLGHVRDARDGKIIIAPDLKQTLAKVDQFEAAALKDVDEYILAKRLSIPPETLPQLRDGYAQAVITELDLKQSGITSVVWATGYTFDYSLVKLPVVDADGYPVQRRGVTEYSGLYFLGMPWLHSRRSGILFGVGDDAAYLAAHIAARDTDASELSQSHSPVVMLLTSLRYTVARSRG